MLSKIIKKSFLFFSFYFISLYFDNCDLIYLHYFNTVIEKKGIVAKAIERKLSVRQTLLFSATALREEKTTKKNNKDKKWLDKVKIKGIGGGAVKMLPLHLQQLLAVVSVMGNTHVSDVTGLGRLTGVGNSGSVSEKGEGKGKEKEKGKEGGSGSGVIEGKKGGKDKDKEKDKKNKNKDDDDDEEEWDGEGEGMYCTYACVCITALRVPMWQKYHMNLFVEFFVLLLCFY
jgi:hypothetical protein